MIRILMIAPSRMVVGLGDGEACGCGHGHGEQRRDDTLDGISPLGHAPRGSRDGERSERETPAMVQ
jgi:hypothetical protein